VQVNSRFVRTPTPSQLDALLDELREGRHDTEVPRHGVLSRVRRVGGLAAPHDVVARERVSIAARSEGSAH
jgi:hypothetical protein